MSGLIVAAVGALSFAALLGVNWYRARSWLEPSVAISAVWAITFVFLFIASDQLYGISWIALLIFVCGLGMFSLGSAVGEAVPVPTRSPTTYNLRADPVILLLLLALLLLGLFPYLQYIRHLTGAPLFSAAYFVEVRVALVAQDVQFGREPLINNLVGLASIAAMLAFAVSESGRRWLPLVVAIVGVAFFYNFLTGAKANVLNLLISLFAIYGLQRRRLPKLGLIVALVLSVVTFGLVTVQRAVGLGADIGSFAGAAHATLDQLGGYLAAGPVGFSTYLAHPEAVAAVWSPWYFFERTANYFGNFFVVPAPYAQFVEIGNGRWYNTYTAFFSYYPAYGVAGVGGFMFAIGTIAGVVYRRAVQGRLLWQLTYAWIFYGVLMTVDGESLLLALNPLLKLLVVGSAVLVLRRVRWGGSRAHVAQPSGI